MRSRAIAARACRSASRSLIRSESVVAFRCRCLLVDLRLEQRQGLRLLPLGDGEERRIRLGVGVHQQVGDEVADRRWRSRRGCRSPRRVRTRDGSCPGRSRRAERSACARTGRRASIQGPEQERIDRHQRLSHLAAHGFPPGVIRVVARQGTGGWKQARHRPASPTPARSRASGSGWHDGVSGHHAAREVRSAWREQAIEEVINLGGIDRQEGEAGVEMFPTLIVGALYQHALSRGSAQRR